MCLACLPGDSDDKESACNAGDLGSTLGWEVPLEEGTASVFLPGESHGQRSLADCSPWGCKESDTTEQQSAVRPIPASISSEPASHSLLLFPLNFLMFFFSLDVSGPLLPFPHLSPLGAIDQIINPYKTL